MRIWIQIPVLAMLLASCAQTSPNTSPYVKTENVSCSVELQGCTGARGACVYMGVPVDGGVCDAKCQQRLVGRLQRSGITVIKAAAPAEPKGCVGYREDLGGTAQGARCLAHAIGYTYSADSCRRAGWPYSIHLK